MQTAVYTIDQFVVDAKEVRRRGLDDLATVEALMPLLDRVVSQPDCLTSLGHGASPDRGIVVYADEELTIRVVVWQPRETTPIHNHNGWALIGVVEGNERNTNYRRLDDGTRPWHAEIEEAGTVEILPGCSSYILPPHDIHAVNIPDVKTVAVHVYGNNLDRQWRYEFDAESGEVRPFKGRTSR